MRVRHVPMGYCLNTATEADFENMRRRTWRGCLETTDGTGFQPYFFLSHNSWGEAPGTKRKQKPRAESPLHRVLRHPLDVPQARDFEVRDTFLRVLRRSQWLARCFSLVFPSERCGKGGREKCTHQPEARVSSQCE